MTSLQFSTLTFHKIAALRARQVLIMLLAISIAGILSGCEPAPPPNKLEQIKKAGVLKVGTIYGRTTFYHGSTGPQGFEYELAERFASQLGVQLQLLPFYSYHALKQDLREGRIDLVAAGDAIPVVNETVFKLGPVYQQVSHKLVFQQGQNRPRRVEDLTAPLLVVKGSSTEQLVSRLQQENPDLQWQSTDNKDIWELLSDVAQGTLAYTVVDTNTLSVQRRQFPQLSIGFGLDEPKGIAWLLNARQDDSLRSAIIQYFGHLHQSGVFKALEDKYFGHIRQFNYVDTRAFIQAAKSQLPIYIDMFRTHAKDIDWRLLAAMSYQESHWQPDAISYTGVQGMMMLTRDTANDLDIASRLDPQSSIEGGARYVTSLIRRIPARIDEPDRIWMALAAYNIGLGHLNDARKLTEQQGGNPDLWVDVKRRLPLLEQKQFYKTTTYGFARGRESKRYVENIRRYYDTLIYLDNNTDLLEPKDPPQT